MRLLSCPLMLATTLMAGAVAVHGQSYAIEPSHSEVDFSIKHMAISTVHGRFSIKSGTIVYDGADLSKAKVEAVIAVTTVNTGEPKRDGHLNSPDFFDTAKYPTAEFKSTSVKKSGEGYDVFGDLTLHGVSKPVTLHLEEPSKEQMGMDGKTAHRGFTATTQINRKDFGLLWNGSLKSGDSVLGDDVKLELNIDGAKQ